MYGVARLRDYSSEETLFFVRSCEICNLDKESIFDHSLPTFCNEIFALLQILPMNFQYLQALPNQSDNQFSPYDSQAAYNSTTIYQRISRSPQHNPFSDLSFLAENRYQKLLPSPLSPPYLFTRYAYVGITVAAPCSVSSLPSPGLDIQKSTSAAFIPPL